MIFELDDTSKVKHIFDGWNETLIYSCIHKVMGKIYVTDIDNPKSAFAFVGCFGFYTAEMRDAFAAIADKLAEYIKSYIGE